MAKLTTVSIIILNYNGKELLSECFSSLLKLDYPKELIEIILIDNGSSDDSVMFMKEYFPNVKIIQNSENLGFAKANNIGIKNAKGKYVALLNNDMRVNENWLKELIIPLIDDNSIGITSSKILNWEGTKIDYAGAGISFSGFGYQRGFGKEFFLYNEPEYCLFPCGGSMAMSKNLFLMFGGFDDDYFAYYEDVDLGWRCWIYGYSMLYVPESIVYHKKSQSITKVKIKYAYLLEKNALCTIFKNYEFKNLIPILFASIYLLFYRIKTDRERRDWYTYEERKDALYFFLINFIKYYFKRIRIQKNRRIKDSTLFSYFRVPMCNRALGYTEDKKYIQVFNSVTEKLKIKRIFCHIGHDTKQIA